MSMYSLIPQQVLDTLYWWPDWMAGQRAIQIEFLETMMEAGVGPTDEVYTSENYGSWHIRPLQEALRKTPERFKFIPMPITQEAIENTVPTLELEHCKTLSLERLSQPLLAVMIPRDPPLFVVDGHHRMYQRHKMGLTECVIAVADPDLSMDTWLFRGREVLWD